ncbi:striatin-interacting protein 1-like isoform X2 [Acanthaster planci]|uniref:Striatin-interacting protein 1-like isoform X2 n=1 Tax=Acanthaster planci TaxID=133434 RepID=A0A8B7YZR3_ACAPL|nr:striatin-interacting protein 1-like isoform X2 [Acanthaster planci]
MEVPMAGGLAAKRGGGLPKLRELLRRQRRDSDSQNDSPDLDFEYDDANKYKHEIAELYSYTEEPEFALCQKCFEEDFHSYIKEKWAQLSPDHQQMHVLHLLNNVESAKREQRMKSARAILYLAQGCFSECSSEEEQRKRARENCFLLYECSVFNTFVELLSMEAENSVAASTALRKPAVSIIDSTDLRVALSVLYIMIETLRMESDQDTDKQKQQREIFKAELGQPVCGDDSLAIILFNMVTKFCSGHAPHFPIKKILLLLWKTLLFSLGGFSEYKLMKQKARKAVGLDPVKEDTIQVTKTMRASSPPASTGDGLQERRTRGSLRRNGIDEPMPEDPDRREEESKEEQLNGGSEEEEENSSQPPPPTPREHRALPWTPKVRQKDVDIFLDHTRRKFVGFQVQSDRETLAGLPQPIHEGVHVLKKHVYVSLAEIQIKQEEQINKNPISKGEENIPATPTEHLYQAMLPNLPQYMISLLKILLTAVPTSKAKTDSINILADVLPEEMPITVLQSMKLGMDVNRHKEIIVKAISALLLLLLKHFKLNHVYQFEFMSQHLVFANCIPLVLKFFNQNIMAYISTKNGIGAIDFPSCVIGDQPELTAESLEAGDTVPYCWRNLFSCINLLRILNKLTKWKHSRTMMLVVFKSAPILKRALKVKQAMMQVYVLKLLKVQTKYLGRQWRKSNMKTMSAIYQKVRHRLNDDWAYGNDMDARPWDFQAEECALRACVDRFNTRRYDQSTPKDPEYQPVDNNPQSVLSQQMELSEEFKRFYEAWLDREVFTTQINWDLLLKDKICT